MILVGINIGKACIDFYQPPFPAWSHLGQLLGCITAWYEGNK